jgi:predicted nucleotidyltransferase component of viral defense system
MKPKRYEAIYALQDEVLRFVFSEAYGFYLTGGTALSRFYLNHRYSDDLDFFSHDVRVFSDAFRLIYEKVLHRWPDASLEVDARDFKRCKIATESADLKMDFVADRVPRIGLPAFVNNTYIDTVRNILSNKICAILGRDEGRDVADLLWIARGRRFSWPGIFEDAMRKDQFAIEEFLYRISSFPIDMLDSIPFVDYYDKTESESSLRAIRADIEKRGSNSLSPPEAPEL